MTFCFPIYRNQKTYGPDYIAGISSARCTNEENYLMQKFMRVVIGTNNIDSCARVCHSPTAIGMQRTLEQELQPTPSLTLYTDCMMVIGANPTDFPSGNRCEDEAGSDEREDVDSNWSKKDRADKICTIPSPTQTRNQCRRAEHDDVLHIKEGLEDKAFIESRTEGYEEFKRNSCVEYPGAGEG